MRSRRERGTRRNLVSKTPGAQSLSLSLSLPPFLSLSLSLFLSLSLSLFLSFSLSLFLPFSRALFLSFSLSLFLFLSLALSLSLARSLARSLSRARALSLSEVEESRSIKDLKSLAQLALFDGYETRCVISMHTVCTQYEDSALTQRGEWCAGATRKVSGRHGKATHCPRLPVTHLINISALSLEPF